MNNQNMIDTVTRISGVNPRKCMRCGKCSASCPVYDEMNTIRISLSPWSKTAELRNCFPRRASTPV